MLISMNETEIKRKYHHGLNKEHGSQCKKLLVPKDRADLTSLGGWL